MSNKPSYPEIAKYQRELVRRGSALPVYGADGRWGGETVGAQHTYQDARNIGRSDLPDTLTVATLNSEAPNLGGDVVNYAILINQINLQSAEARDAGATDGTEGKGGVPWWGWMLILGGVIVIVALIFRYVLHLI